MTTQHEPDPLLTDARSALIALLKERERELRFRELVKTFGLLPGKIDGWSAVAEGAPRLGQDSTPQHVTPTMTTSSSDDSATSLGFGLALVAIVSGWPIAPWLLIALTGPLILSLRYRWSGTLNLSTLEEGIQSLVYAVAMIAALACVGHVVYVSWYVSAVLIALGIGAYVALSRGARAAEIVALDPGDRVTALRFQLWSGVLAASVCLLAGTAPVCLAQFLLGTVGETWSASVVWKAEIAVCQVREALSSALSLDLLSLCAILALLVTASVAAPRLRLTATFSWLRGWAGRALLALTAATSFTFFGAAQSQYAETDLLDAHRAEIETEAHAVLMLRREVVAAQWLRADIADAAESQKQQFRAFIVQASERPRAREIVELHALESAFQLAKVPAEAAEKAPAAAKGATRPADGATTAFSWVESDLPARGDRIRVADVLACREEASRLRVVASEARAAAGEALRAAMGSAWSAALDPLLSLHSNALVDVVATHVMTDVPPHAAASQEAAERWVAAWRKGTAPQSEVKSEVKAEVKSEQVARWEMSVWPKVALEATGPELAAKELVTSLERRVEVESKVQTGRIAETAAASGLMLGSLRGRLQAAKRPPSATRSQPLGPAGGGTSTVGKTGRGGETHRAYEPRSTPRPPIRSAPSRPAARPAR